MVVLTLSYVYGDNLTKKMELQRDVVMMFATAQLLCFQCLTNPVLNLGDKMVVSL